MKIWILLCRTPMRIWYPTHGSCFISERLIIARMIAATTMATGCRTGLNGAITATVCPQVLMLLRDTVISRTISIHSIRTMMMMV